MSEEEIRSEIFRNKMLLSICIPTYNRGQILKGTLDNIISQALEFGDKVEICISDNCSTDDTKEIVMKLKEKYPLLIKYDTNEKNIGFDRNIIKVVGMAEGRFAWTFGDYSFLNDGGLKEVINLLENIQNENVGLVGVRQDVYIVDENNNKQVVQTNIDKTRPQIIKLNAKETMERESIRGVMNVILNTNSMKNIYKENYSLVKMGIGTLYMHAWLHYIMFILDPNLKCYIINKAIVLTPDNRRKLTIEDEFTVVCNGNIRFLGLLESICRERGEYDLANVFSKKKKLTKIFFIHAMVIFKYTDQLEYNSYAGCIKSFYHCLKFVDASLFSFSFLILSLTPGYFLRSIVKIYLKIKHGEKAESVWNDLSGHCYRNPNTTIGLKSIYRLTEWRGEDRIKLKF